MPPAAACPRPPRARRRPGERRRREWTPEDLIACWTLLEDHGRLVGNKAGATRLGFALLLTFFEHEGRFPRHGGEVPRQAVAYVAEQVGVAPALFAAYPWAGRTVAYHRAQIREALGFRECAVADEGRLSAWLAEAVCPAELGPERQREALLARCRAERLEPPGPSRVERLLGAARARAEHDFAARTVARLPGAVADRLEALVAADRGDETATGPVALPDEGAHRFSPGWPLPTATLLFTWRYADRPRREARSPWSWRGRGACRAWWPAGRRA
jgi:hypothetical protein